MDAQRVKHESIIYWVFIWSFMLELNRENVGLILLMPVPVWKKNLLWNLWTCGLSTEVKGAILGLTFIQTEPACSVVWCWTGKRGNGGKKGPRLLSAFLGCVCLLVWAHVHVYAQTYVQFVFILWVLKASKHGSNKGSWHTAASFVWCHLIFWSVCCAGLAQRQLHGKPWTQRDIRHE